MHYAIGCGRSLPAESKLDRRNCTAEGAAGRALVDCVVGVVADAQVFLGLPLQDAGGRRGRRFAAVGKGVRTE